MPGEVTFPSVLEAARLGEEWAWTSIYRDFSPMVLRYLRARHASDAEDILGEVFVRVVRKLPDFSGSERDFRAWVLTITRNRMIDAARRECRSPVHTTKQDLIEAEAVTEDPEEKAAQLLSSSAVVSVLKLLSADQRDVVFLRVFADLTVDEVARIMGKSPAAVKALQARGLAAIRDATSWKPAALPGRVRPFGPLERYPQ